MNIKHKVRDFAIRVAPEYAAQILAWKSQRLIMRLERERGQLGASQRFCKENGLIVRDGPFAGMIYPESTVKVRNLIPKMIASYEDELTPWIEEAVAKNYPTIVNVGSADGYYAVGLARRLPGA
jgi:hypothetical protein